MGEKSPVLLKRNIYTTYSVAENSPLTFTQWNFYVLTLWKFLKNTFSLTYVISCLHMEKRNVDKVMKLYYTSSKMERVMNFQMNMWVIFHPLHTAKVKMVICFALPVDDYRFSRFISVLWPIGSSGGTWGLIQRRSSSSLFCRKSLWALLA